MRRRLRGPPLHIYKYVPFWLFYSLPSFSSRLPPSALFFLIATSAFHYLLPATPWILELYLSPASLRAPCLRGNGCLLSLRRPTLGDTKTSGCSPVMAVVFLAQVRLNLTLGTMSEFFFSPILIGVFLFLLIPFSWIFLLSQDRNCI